MTRPERSLVASIAAHTSWANTENRAERTEPARRALDERFLEEAGGDPQRAESLRRAHFQRLALKSVQSRRRARELTAAAEQAEAEQAEQIADFIERHLENAPPLTEDQRAALARLFASGGGASC